MRHPSTSGLFGRRLAESNSSLSILRIEIFNICHFETETWIPTDLKFSRLFWFNQNGDTYMLETNEAGVASPMDGSAPDKAE